MEAVWLLMVAITTAKMAGGIVIEVVVAARHRNERLAEVSIFRIALQPELRVQHLSGQDSPAMHVI